MMCLMPDCSGLIVRGFVDTAETTVLAMARRAPSKPTEPARKLRRVIMHVRGAISDPLTTARHFVTSACASARIVGTDALPRRTRPARGARWRHAADDAR